MPLMLSRTPRVADPAPDFSVNCTMPGWSVASVM